MSEPVRIALRLLGVVLLLAGIAGIVILFNPGPSEVADWMGNSCAHSENGPSESCNVLDVLSLVAVAPILILVGGVMALALGPDKGTGAGFTIDLSRRK